MIKKILNLLITIILTGTFLLSCSTQKQYSSKSIRGTNRENIRQQATIRALYDQYKDWLGTPHKIGGLTRKGVDCSGLVYLTYLNKFDIKLPRTTRKQAAIGKTVTKKRLQPGDLLFFKIGFFKGHVGIYIEDGFFLHSSTSQGVTISNLDDIFWKDTFLKAKRIDFQ